MRPNLRRPEFHGSLVKSLKRKNPTRRKLLLAKGEQFAWTVPEIYFKSRLPTQGLIPVKKDLTKNLGINAGEKVVVFAGYLGDWAKALSKETRLVYTDINSEIKSFVKRNKKGSIARFKTISGESIPQRSRIYDWSFSYEPIPLIMQGTLKITLARSLLNNKGGKIVFSDGFKSSSKEAWEKHVKPLENIYGAKVDLQKIQLEVHDPIKPNLKNVMNEKFSLITIRTNDKIRKQVFLDLRILNAVDKAVFYERKLTISQIAKNFRVSRIEVIRSISRLEELLGQKQKGFLYRVISAHV